VDGPLILDAKNELLFFKTAADLEGWVEAIDVENGEYSDCWNSAGQLFCLRTERRPILGGWMGSRALVRIAATGASRAADLRRALIRFLVGFGDRESAVTTLSMADLVARGAKRAGWR